jgi:hypothetical protein
MALKHTWTTSIRTDNGGGVADSIVVSGPAEANCSAIALAGQVLEIDLPVDVSQILSGFVESDQAVTLKTNSTTSAAQTFALTAKRAVAWKTGDIATCPWTTDVTRLYWDNSAGDTDANVKAGFLLDL